jgi:hypothetical protein
VTRYFTKKRLLYAILSPTAGQIKIGISAAPLERMKDLQWAHGQPLELLVEVDTRSYTRTRERAIHRRLAPHRLAGEWFRSCPDVLAVVEELKAEARMGANPFRRKDMLADVVEAV